MDTRRAVGEIPGSCWTVHSPGYIARMLRTGVLVRLIAVCLGTVAVLAQDATWSTTPGSSNWNTAANWVPPTGPPAVPTGTATFGLSTTTTITVSTLTSVEPSRSTRSTPERQLIPLVFQAIISCLPGPVLSIISRTHPLSLLQSMRSYILRTYSSRGEARLATQLLTTTLQVSGAFDDTYRMIIDPATRA